MKRGSQLGNICLHVIVCLGMLGLPPCKTKSSNNNDALRSNKLDAAAREMFMRHGAAFSHGRIAEYNIIREEYWAPVIRELKPMKVYKHRGNIVVVQRIVNNREEGKYIWPGSSYLPENGVDGYFIMPNPQKGNLYDTGDGVFDYHKSIHN